MATTRLLIVTRNFPPLTGGMERLIKHSVDGLADDYEISLIGPAGCGEFCPAGVRVYECPANAVGFLVIAMLKGLVASFTRRHALVFGGSGLVAPITRILAFLRGARSVVHVHGLDLVVPNAVYQSLFVPFIRRHDLVIANSDNTRRLAVEKRCAPDRVRVLHPGTEFPDEDGVAAARAGDPGFGDGTVCLFVGRMIRRKGLAEFLERAWPTVHERLKDARLVVVGDSPENALVRDRDGAQAIVDAVAACPPDSVVFLGGVDNATLWSCYARANALVFPLIDVRGDVEGFGMVAVEAAAYGTPTVAFAEGGVVDAVADGKSGRLVEPGDYARYADTLIDVLASGRPTADECRLHAEKFSWANHREALARLVADTLADRKA